MLLVSELQVTVFHYILIVYLYPLLCCFSLCSLFFYFRSALRSGLRSSWCISCSYQVLFLILFLVQQYFRRRCTSLCLLSSRRFVQKLVHTFPVHAFPQNTHICTMQISKFALKDVGQLLALKTQNIAVLYTNSRWGRCDLCYDVAASSSKIGIVINSKMQS